MPKKRRIATATSESTCAHPIPHPATIESSYTNPIPFSGHLTVSAHVASVYTRRAPCRHPATPKVLTLTPFRSPITSPSTHTSSPCMPIRASARSRPSSGHFRKLLRQPHSVLRSPHRLRSRRLRVCPSAFRRALYAPPFTYPLSHNTRSPALPSGPSLAIPFLRHRPRMYPHATLSPSPKTPTYIFKKF